MIDLQTSANPSLEWSDTSEAWWPTAFASTKSTDEWSDSDESALAISHDSQGAPRVCWMKSIKKLIIFNKTG